MTLPTPTNTKPSDATYKHPSPSPAAVTLGRKKSIFTKTYPWSPLRYKRQRGLDWALLDQNIDALHTGAGNLRSTVTAVEPPLEDARALTTDQSGDSQGIPETPAAALENVWREGDIPWEGNYTCVDVDRLRLTEPQVRTITIKRY